MAVAAGTALRKLEQECRHMDLRVGVTLQQLETARHRKAVDRAARKGVVVAVAAADLCCQGQLETRYVTSVVVCCVVGLAR